METLALLVIALLNLFTGYLAWKTKKNVEKVEVATNSMKDALVKATAEASHAKGVAQEKADQAERNSRTR